VIIADEDAVLIKNLYLPKGWSARKLLDEFRDKGWKLGSIKYLLKKIRKMGTVNRQPGGDALRSARTDENSETLDDLVLSREDSPKRTNRRAKFHVKLAFTVLVSIGSFTVIFNSSASSVVVRDNYPKPTASPV